LFPELPPYLVGEEKLENELGSGDVDGDEVTTSGPMLEPIDGSEAEDSDRIPSPFVFFGQFIDHDITLDVTTEFESEADPEAVENFRTPALEMDNVFGQGREASRFLYASESVDADTEGHKLLLHESDPEYPALQRNQEGTAIIGDPRNDENIVIARLHAGMINFYNQVLEALADDEGPDFERRCETIGHEARRLTRWHYQWIILHEFLPLVCGKDIVCDVLANGPRFYQPTGDNPYIPVEFAVAAYRFGHSQVRAKYRLTEDDDLTLLFDFPKGRSDDEEGERRHEVELDWNVLFDQYARPIDTKLAVSLFDLPFIEGDGEEVVADLAARNLRRGRVYLLPSGEEVAERMGHVPNNRIDVEGFEQTPLWYYVLAEAQRQEEDRLGKVGGRIVAETLIGLLLADDKSFVNVAPDWKPTTLFDIQDEVDSSLDIMLPDDIVERRDVPEPQGLPDDVFDGGESFRGDGEGDEPPRFPIDGMDDDEPYVLEQLLAYQYNG
jgi:hypothetical protein